MFFFCSSSGFRFWIVLAGHSIGPWSWSIGLLSNTGSVIALVTRFARDAVTRPCGSPAEVRAGNVITKDGLDVFPSGSPPSLKRRKCAIRDEQPSCRSPDASGISPADVFATCPNGQCQTVYLSERAGIPAGSQLLDPHRPDRYLLCVRTNPAKKRCRRSTLYQSASRVRLGAALDKSRTIRSRRTPRPAFRLCRACSSALP